MGFVGLVSDGSTGIRVHRHAGRAVRRVHEVLAGQVVGALDVAVGRRSRLGAQCRLPARHRGGGRLVALDLRGVGADRAAGAHRVERQGDGDPVGPSLGTEWRRDHTVGHDIRRVLLGRGTPGHDDQPALGHLGPAAGRGLQLLAAPEARGLEACLDLEQLVARAVPIGTGEVDLVRGAVTEVRVEPERLRIVRVLVVVVVGLLADHRAVHRVEGLDQVFRRRVEVTERGAGGRGRLAGREVAGGREVAPGALADHAGVLGARARLRHRIGRG